MLTGENSVRRSLKVIIGPVVIAVAVGIVVVGARAGLAARSEPAAADTEPSSIVEDFLARTLLESWPSKTSG